MPSLGEIIFVLALAGVGALVWIGLIRMTGQAQEDLEPESKNFLTRL